MRESRCGKNNNLEYFLFWTTHFLNALFLKFERITMAGRLSKSSVQPKISMVSKNDVRKALCSSALELEAKGNYSAEKIDYIQKKKVLVESTIKLFNQQAFGKFEIKIGKNQ